MNRHDDIKGRTVARDWAQWNLGHPSWADKILDAYFHPDKVADLLAREKDGAE